MSKNDSFKTLFPNINQHEIDLELFSNEVVLGYSKFKEILYKKLHGTEKWSISSIAEIDGYNDYMLVVVEFSKKIKEIIEDYGINIVNIHDYQLFALLDEEIKAKKILSLHTPVLSEYDPDTINWIKSLISKSELTIVSVPSYKNLLCDKNNCEKIITLPPFIDMNLQDNLKKINKCEFSSKSKKSENFCVSSIQRFDSKSGHKQLINGFAEFVKEHPKSKLLLIGGPSFTDKISKTRHKYFLQAKKLVNDLNIEQKVEFIGSVPYECLEEIYKITDVFCMLSKNECFGLALTEAMARKKAIIVTKVGGLEYQINDEVEGICVPVGDEKSFTQALIVYTNKDIRDKYSRNAFKKYTKEFYYKLLFDKYFKVLSSFI